ncbi:MAG TPA: glycosyltransferase family 4 protein [Novosphingobium sp.]
MPRPRAAYLINAYPKVSHAFIRREILELEAQGVTVDRYALRGWDAEVVDESDRIERERTRYTLRHGALALLGPVLRIAMSRPAAFVTALRAALAMSRRGLRPWPFHLVYLAHACQIAVWLKATPAQHLHAHFGTNSTEIAMLVSLLGGPDYSFTVHGMDEVDNARALHLDTKVARARFAVAVSAYSRSQLLRILPPAEWDKVKVVHCGLEQSYFADEPPPLPPLPVFLCVARLSAEKAHLILLEAFAAVHAAHPTARLVLAGDGDMRGLIEGRIAALNLGDAVEITGWVSADEVRTRLIGAHALVLPSFIEGLPVVIMEAAAMCRPVISTYVAGIPELVQSERTGWLVPAGDPASLAEAMMASIEATPEQLNAMGRQGQARARAQHDIAREVAKLRSLFFEGAA